MAAVGEPSEGESRTGRIPLAAGVAVLGQTLDSTAIAVLLPAMAAELNVGLLDMSLIVSLYFLGGSATVPISGWLADRYGPRDMFRASVLLVGIAALVCSLAHTLTPLLIARFIQGAAASMLLPIGRLLVVRSTPGRHLVSALATFTTPALLGPMLGPLLGGFCARLGGWEGIFILTAALSVGSAALLSHVAVNKPESRPAPLDVRGALLTSSALVVLVAGLQNLTGRHPLIGAAATLVGLVLGLAAVRHSRRAATPLVQLSILRIRPFRLCLSADLIVRLVLGAVPLLASLLLQTGCGYAPEECGLMLMLVAVGSVATKPFIARSVDRFGYRIVMVSGSLGGSLLFMACALFQAATPMLLVGMLFFGLGFCRSLVLTNAGALSFNAVETADTGAASSLMSTTQQLVQVVGVAVAIMLINVLAWYMPEVVAVRWTIFLTAATTVPAAWFLWNLPSDIGRQPDHIHPPGR